MTNPILSDWTTPFEIAPFARISDNDFAPALEQAMAAHNAQIDAIANNHEPASFANTIEALEAAGFDKAEFKDQSRRTAALAEGYLERSQGELRETLDARMGEDGFAAHLEWTRVRAGGLADGGSGYGHFIARRPTD